MLAGTYNLVNRLGDGAFSEVYEVVHKDTNLHYAAKILNTKGFLHDDKALRRLRDEISILRECDHPNILKFVENFRSDSQVVIITEVCQGGELWTKIDEGFIPECEAVLLFRQLLEGVQYLHNRGIVHRDLKPENIFFRNTSDNTLVIADFGFAKKVTKNSLLTSDVGTAEYAAPEILSQRYGKEVDSWALGCILYCMLYCHPPFFGADVAEILNNILSEKPIHFFDEPPVSDAAQDLILKLLDRNPQNRLSISAALQHPWIQRINSTSSLKLSTEGARGIKPAGKLRGSLNAIIDYEFLKSNKKQIP